MHQSPKTPVRSSAFIRRPKTSLIAETARQQRVPTHKFRKTQEPPPRENDNLPIMRNNCINYQNPPFGVPPSGRAPKPTSSPKPHASNTFQPTIFEKRKNRPGQK